MPVVDDELVRQFAENGFVVVPDLMGKGIREALLGACPIRLRPILMTSFATMAAALPAALSFGPGSETMKPLGVVVIGGILVSTFFTLLVVPCLYSILSPKRDTFEERVEKAS